MSWRLFHCHIILNSPMTKLILIVVFHLVDSINGVSFLIWMIYTFISTYSWVNSIIKSENIVSQIKYSSHIQQQNQQHTLSNSLDRRKVINQKCAILFWVLKSNVGGKWLLDNHVVLTCHGVENGMKWVWAIVVWQWEKNVPVVCESERQ